MRLKRRSPKGLVQFCMAKAPPRAEMTPNALISKNILAPFLLNFTDPDTKTILEYFEAPTSDRTAPSFLSAVSPAMAGFDMALNAFEASPFSNYNIEDLFDLSIFSPPQHYPSYPNLGTISLWSDQLEQSDILQGRLIELVSQLSSVSSSLSHQNSQSGSSFSNERAGEFFPLGNIKEFIGAYFDYWDCHCPILHRPSFEPEIASLPLLLAIVLTGAAYSSPRDTAAIAREFLDVAEEYIFEHEAFRNIVQKGHFLAASETKLDIQPLQAALIMAIL